MPDALLLAEEWKSAGREVAIATVANRLGCMSPAGEPLCDGEVSTPASGARCIAARSNGRLYFTSYDASTIGEVILD